MLIAFGSTAGVAAGIGSPCPPDAFPDAFPTDDATSRVPPGPVLSFGGGASAVGEDFAGETAGDIAFPDPLFGGVAGAATELFPVVPFGAAVGGAFTGGLAAGAPPISIGFSLGGGVAGGGNGAGIGGGVGGAGGGAGIPGSASNLVVDSWVVVARPVWGPWRLPHQTSPQWIFQC
eukprot:s4482_g8.t1